jgi:hypothetical protein
MAVNKPVDDNGARERKKRTQRETKLMGDC